MVVKKLRESQRNSKSMFSWIGYNKKEYKYEECVNDQNELLNNGYEKIYTDEKTDYVYKKIEEYRINNNKLGAIRDLYENISSYLSYCKWYWF